MAALLLPPHNPKSPSLAWVVERALAATVSEVNAVPDLASLKDVLNKAEDAMSIFLSFTQEEFESNTELSRVAKGRRKLPDKLGFSEENIWGNSLEICQFCISDG